MTSEKGQQNLLEIIAAVRAELTRELGPELMRDPRLAEAINLRMEQMQQALLETGAPGTDYDPSELLGLGAAGADSLGDARIPPGVTAYDETVMAERLVAVGDLYYLYQHERIGVFKVVQKLQELFRAGTVRLSSGPGAFALYQFDRREVLRYTRRDRLGAYRRVLGYGGPQDNLPGSRPNTEFHPMFTNFNNQVALYWRDKRISDVVRTGALDPTFGSVAIVRRSGLDLRNNLKHTSFGNLNVMRVEVMQLLNEAFRILSADDVRRLFGADNAWDVIEEVLTRYFGEQLVTSPRQRMAVAGRNVLRWLAQPHITQSNRTQFEALLMEVAEYAEEWLTSAQSLGLSVRSDPRESLFERRSFPAGLPLHAAARFTPTDPRNLN